MVAQEAVEQLDLDRFVFIVAGLPPHKVGEPLTAPEIRLEMTRAAIAENPVFHVSDLELRRTGPSYTVDTLRYFQDAYPEASLFFVLGADQLAELNDWRDPGRILEMATLVAVARDGNEPRLPSSIQEGGWAEGRVVDLPSVRVDISSSEIRARAGAGRSIQYLVPEGVRRIIEDHRLYQMKS